jgi:hypothetical protein
MNTNAQQKGLGGLIRTSPEVVQKGDRSEHGRHGSLSFMAAFRHVLSI